MDASRVTSRADVVTTHLDAAAERERRSTQDAEQALIAMMVHLDTVHPEHRPLAELANDAQQRIDNGKETTA